MNTYDKIQFLSLIDEHQGIISNLCRVYFVNLEDQQDARQDVILQLWKAFPNFRAEAKAGTFIYRVALNTILKKLRTNKKYKHLLSIDELEISSHSIVVDDDQQLLKQILLTLKEEDKALLVLQLEGYKQNEIATILDTTSTNISTRWHRIKKVLKQKFKSLYYETR